MTVFTLPAALADERLGLLGQAFFANRGSGEALAIDESVDDLIATIWSHRRKLAPAVAVAPDAAFAAQSPDANGEPRWAAGQIVAHVLAAQSLISTPVIHALLDEDGIARFRQPDDPGPPPLLEREQALAMLPRAEMALSVLLDCIPPDAGDDTDLDHAYFGPLTLKGMLLLMALHERTHVRQVREL